MCIDETRSSESDVFHSASGEVAEGKTTERVKKIVVEAYVRGAPVGCAERAEVEGSTIVFTKRRYRDRWNRLLVNTLVLPSTSALSAQPTGAPRTYASTTIFFTRSVVFPSATSPKAEWKTSD